ncbi:MAG: gliding motility-associated C-terminal domain-containing protein [Bacteroidales bacterium]|nr:gliding motility-associated C-terminal domain-containing protein [Bacteroidales bacterium]
MRKTFILISALIYSTFLWAQIPTTQGTEFWLTFMYNHSTSATTNLILSAKNATTGTVSNPNAGWSTNFSIPAQGRVEVSIPNTYGYMTSTEQVQNMGILVQSNDTISVYAANYIAYTFDATNILPIQALGDEHIISTYNGQYDGSEFAIVATQNNTIVDITPSVYTQGGHSAGTTYSITLNRGQSYQVISSSATADLSGSKVVARDCKKIAVFAGCRCTNIPNGCPYCDHIVEQTWPVFSWGQEFVVTSSLTRTQDRVRVTAAANGTQIYADGQYLTTLNAGSSYEFTMSNSKTSAYLTSTQPVCVYLYIVGSSCGGSNGDPASVWISPVEQRLQEITFGTFSPGQTLTQYLNIVTPTLGLASMQLDGNNIAGQFQPVPGNNNYSFARMSVAHGTHTIQCDSGVVAHVYGLGTDESYAYSAGSSAANLKSKMFVNDVSSVDISALQEYCYGDSIFFKGNVQMAYDSIIWEFGDGSFGSGDSLYHLYPTYGIYQVNMIIDRRSTNNNCGGFDTISSIVRILQNDTTIHESICYGFNYNANGFSIVGTHDTLMTNIYPTVWGCDSVVHLDLKVFPIDPIHIPITICKGEFYLENDFAVIGQEVGYHSYTNYGISEGGCDSTTILDVTVVPVPEPNLGKDIIICDLNQFPITLNAGEFDHYFWSTGDTTQAITVSSEGTYSVTVSLSYNKPQTGTINYHPGLNCMATDEVEIFDQHVNVTISQDVDYCDDYVTTLTAETDATNVLWDNGETTPSITVYQNGSYSVKAYNEYCQTAAHINIPECPFDLYVPNTFSPYVDDGVNDYFYVSGNKENVSQFVIYIYDRWGKLVYESNDINFKWDGKVDGKFIPNHTFNWVIKLSTLLGKKMVFKGHVNVL